jgi:RHS repeat-associated protein
MELASGTAIKGVLPLAACPQLAENSRLGFGADAGTVRWASSFVISSTSLGMSGPLYDSRVRSRYTGKERDTESGLDYFGARYYSSNMGRWMSPDWADKPEAVPYSDLTNPQSLNLYGYVNNNPLSKADKDGHCAEDFCVVEGGVTAYFAGAAVLAGASAYLSTPSGQRSLDTFTSAAGASFSSSFHSLTSLFSKSDSSTPAPATPAAGQSKPGDSTSPAAPAAPGTQTALSKSEDTAQMDIPKRTLTTATIMGRAIHIVMTGGGHLMAARRRTQTGVQGVPYDQAILILSEKEAK